MILLVYGTRPEWIKIKPLIKEFKNHSVPYNILFTGQHKDISPKNYDFNITMCDENINNRLDNIIHNCMNIPEKYFKDIKYLLVQGDTSTALGLSLAAFHRKIKIIHLEAGLRTYNFENPYPEEGNRQLISRISDINFCPTIENYNNLKKECAPGDSYIVGNTILDNIVNYKNSCKYTNKILVTLHRRENHIILDKWFFEINKLAKEYKELEFILPLHPNPDVQKHKNILTDVNIINPLEHDELINLLIKTKLVITDSGGIQEECSFFNKKTLVCRKFTERIESVGLTSFLVENPENLFYMFDKHIKDYNINYESPYGDGYASNKIYKLLTNYEIF